MLGGGKLLIKIRVCLDFNNKKPEKVSYSSFQVFLTHFSLKLFYINIQI